MGLPGSTPAGDRTGHGCSASRPACSLATASSRRAVETRPRVSAATGALDEDEIEELAQRIDAEREGAALLRRCEQLPAVERAAIELVDMEGLTPKEAALALGVSRVAFRQRLSRARSRLRKEQRGNE